MIIRFIPTRIHGFLDYVVFAFLMASPWVFKFSGPGNACYVPVVFGLIGILYSIVTNYEWGVIKVISMPMHLTFDLAIGVILTVSPWLFGFSRAVYLPHLVIGLLIMCVSLTTSPSPYKRKGGNLVEQGYSR